MQWSTFLITVIIFLPLDKSNSLMQYRDDKISY